VSGLRPLEQLADVRCGRRALKFRDASSLLNAPGPHNDNLVGETRRFGQVMRHQDRGEAKLASDALERLVRLTARDGVEGTEWLVEQNHVLPSREGTRQCNALALTPG